jgi:hypothetical protein
LINPVNPAQLMNRVWLNARVARRPGWISKRAPHIPGSYARSARTARDFEYALNQQC